MQIAGLSLWLRAQKSWQAQGVKPADRPTITRSNIVCAEPMPGDAQMLAEFAAGLQPKVLGELVKVIFEKMKLAGEAGSLLKIEEEIAQAVEEARKAYEDFVIQQRKDAGYLPGLAPERDTTLLDLMEVPAPERFWAEAESRLIDALRAYAEQAQGDGLARRLFAADAARGFAFIDVCRKRYDVALMNPPFGNAPRSLLEIMEREYPKSKWDIAAVFTERLADLLQECGMLGTLSTRIPLFTISFEEWRRRLFLTNANMTVMADLGGSVLDDAMVETSAFCVKMTPSSSRNDERRCSFQRIGLEWIP